MTVISDTTPIISLIKIEKLELLRTLFDEVLIPNAVFEELTTNESFSQESKLVKNADFIKIAPVQNLESLKILQTLTGLDDGESEAIVLAGEKNSDVLVIDERKGRKIAQKLGLKITGTVGILIQANSENLLSAEEVKNCLEELKDSKIRLSTSLIERAIKLLT